MSPETLSAIEAEADRSYDGHPGTPLTPPAAEPLRRLLPDAPEQVSAA